MFYFAKLLEVLLLATSLVLSVATPPQLLKREPTCYNITFPVTISVANGNLPSLATLQALGLIAWLEDVAMDLVFDVPATGTYTIAARYCEPEVYVESRYFTLQFLVHGLTYTRNYWSGDGAPGYGYNGDQYSWIAYASKQGYPTLSIDRLGNGLSDHPDPILVTQSPAELATIHQIVDIIRNGNLPIPESRAFTKIIYAGHSYGSCLANALNAQYPNDVDATILTGFSSAFDTNLPGTIVAANVVPADVENPGEFGTLSPGYVEIATQVSDALLFYYPGGYDPNLFNLDYLLRGTAGAGELATVAITKSVSTLYTGKVLVMTGQYDAIFCNPLGLPTHGNCEPRGLLGIGSDNYLADTQSLYPAADFTWYQVPNSGHCWHFHYAGPAGFAYAHNWMAAKGF